MKVLVTGARGMLGAATAQWIAADGHQVTVMQRGDAALPFRQVRADITDESAVQGACSGQDAIVHLAAKVSISGPYAEFERVNVQGTKVLLDAARRSGVERFVYVSSPSVAHAGHALVGAPAAPADPNRARSSYSRTKARAEQLVLASDLATVSVRPHLVWGPGDPQLIERIVRRAQQGRLVVLGSGGALIDTTVVENAASAIGHALRRVDRPEVRGQAFVVSNGEPRTVRELLERITEAAGVPGPKRRVPARLAWFAGGIVEAAWAVTGRSDDPPMTRFLAEQLSTAHWFDQQRTREALDWTPAVSLEEGFRQLAAWHSQGGGTTRYT